MKYRVITETNTSTDTTSNHRSLVAAAKAAEASADYSHIAYVVDDDDRRLKDFCVSMLADGWMDADEAEWF